MNEFTRQLLAEVVEEDMLQEYVFYLLIFNFSINVTTILTCIHLSQTNTQWLRENLWNWRLNHSIWWPAESYQVLLKPIFPFPDKMPHSSQLFFWCRILENHQREQKDNYETQVEGLKLKVDHLQNENNKLQNLFQEKSDVNDSICHEVSRLSSENLVCLIYRMCFHCIV